MSLVSNDLQYVKKTNESIQYGIEMARLRRQSEKGRFFETLKGFQYISADTGYFINELLNQQQQPKDQSKFQRVHP